MAVGGGVRFHCRQLDQPGATEAQGAELARSGEMPHLVGADPDVLGCFPRREPPVQNRLVRRWHARLGRVVPVAEVWLTSSHVNPLDHGLG